jgi:hypothetical protein
VDESVHPLPQPLVVLENLLGEHRLVVVRSAVVETAVLDRLTTPQACGLEYDDTA